MNYGVQGTQELEPTDILIASEEMGEDHYDLLIVLSNNDCSRAEA